RGRESRGPGLDSALDNAGVLRNFHRVRIGAAMIQSIMHSIQSIGFMIAFRESALVYPVILSTHLAMIALFGGLILMTDLRLMGLALKSYTITEVITSLRPWKHV